MPPIACGTTGYGGAPERDLIIDVARTPAGKYGGSESSCDDSAAHQRRRGAESAYRCERNRVRWDERAYAKEEDLEVVEQRRHRDTRMRRQNEAANASTPYAVTVVASPSSGCKNDARAIADCVSSGAGPGRRRNDRRDVARASIPEPPSLSPF